jgi:hypothetical protein
MLPKWEQKWFLGVHKNQFHLHDYSPLPLSMGSGGGGRGLPILNHEELIGGKPN